MSVEKKSNPFMNSYIYYLYDRKQNRIYVGSSYTSFKKRLYDHKYDLKAYLGQATNKHPRSYRTSFDIIIQDDYESGILEKYPCNSKKELHFRESEWILAFRQKNIEVMNKVIPNGECVAPTLPSCFFPLPSPKLVQ
jgi:hypothetical protein